LNGTLVSDGCHIWCSEEGPDWGGYGGWLHLDNLHTTTIDANFYTSFHDVCVKNMLLTYLERGQRHSSADLTQLISEMTSLSAS